MQDHFERYVFGSSDETIIQLSFVGTLGVLLSNGLGFFSQSLEFLIGVKKSTFIGTILVTTGLVAAGSATEIWQLYLSIGVCYGLGDTLLYSPSMRMVAEWVDDKHRSTAMSIVASSTGATGLVTPIIMSTINRNLGEHWTFRILGITYLACNMVACAVFKKRRRSDGGGELKKPTDSLKLSILKDANLIIWCFSALLQSMALYIPYLFLPSYATYLGLSETQGSLLLSVASGASFVGRIITGVIADRIGCVNVNIVCTTIAGIATFTVWTFAYSFESLVGYAILIGSFGGTFYALFGPITVAILGMEQYALGFSWVLLATCPGVLGSTIASAIESRSKIEPFLSYKLFCGALYIGSAITTSVVRWRVSKTIFGKV
ncbi:major facilitator superfamily domain-containing protein [Zychaea mexicana]|uniref:major facilitator superfamily domain-containing protein n=1 Tax=Zychaea mexicana TaxID=64656 RepID=UPI0022FDC320|nr:major facilitator superfamily domain-containing protein [Zychaea mexicana]KAI9490258.1 major facilitator superfamily domain-containing protein [Zychaea mexicana]